MRGSEKEMWKVLRPHLHAPKAPGWAAMRVENTALVGTPDVNWVGCIIQVHAPDEGWIELKYLPKWPKRPATPVVIEHFTLEQRLWLTKRCMLGARADLLLKVGAQDWLLFDGQLAAELIGKAPRRELECSAVVHCTGPISEIAGKLRIALCR